MLQKLLIANRGEIACRIIKTAKKLGIKTIAIYSSADKNAMHVKLADEAFLIGPAISSESYLNQEKIVEVALKTKADAIHPGYGFLAENFKFARLCEKKGINYIGPPASAIAIMGDKRQSKYLMNKIGVPTTPSYYGDSQDLETLKIQAEKIGFPILIKAAHGGGGKGIRLVTTAQELESALLSAKREAKSSFNTDIIFLEKYIKAARHIEVQIFVDQQGNGVYLFDRDCSIQRRYQKIIEEAIAPNLQEKTRYQMGKIALHISTAVNYVGAGTVEFLVDSFENFYFMEMNTRLQVEHTVTEMITGIDLVEWQIKIACGELLPLSQQQIKMGGHAFEARVYAENPFNHFTPSTGKIIYLSSPKESKNIRFDTGFSEGDTITTYYDSLIAKLIVHGENRESALTLLEKSLKEIVIIGIHTNIPLLHKICQTKSFRNAHFHNTFVKENFCNHYSKLITTEILLFACVAELEQQKQEACKLASQSEDSFSPWFARDHWRLSGKSKQRLHLWYENSEYKINITHQNPNTYLMDVQNQIFLITYQHNKHQFTIHYKQHAIKAVVIVEPDFFHILYNGQYFILARHNPLVNLDETSTEGKFNAPMPGKIIEILVKPNQKVKKGDPLLILESMKMEYTIAATRDGIVKTIFFPIGNLVDEGAELLTLI